MGCDYIGNKDGGEIEVTFTVYASMSNIPKTFKMKIPVDKDSRVYEEVNGDIEER